MDQNGNAAAGKACSDTKTLAVFIPGHGVHSFKIPPASLKNFGLYVKQLSAAGIPLGMVKTLVGFDLKATFPVVVFQFGGYVIDGIPEKNREALLAKLEELSSSVETEDIIGGITAVSAQASTPASQVEKKPKVEPTPVPEPKQEVSNDDLAEVLGLDEPIVEPEILDPEPAPETSADASGVSDADLAAELGL